ncbi:fungal-specific transcription factor domain-containing protein [Xylaria bambusicola]|uniref:fungal-specific transcription factor domain-containing protein n=1 Tax=Xylaria bambusicola TaxID=326684 RepID=UPI002007A20B|nr:fungal-specific transcription factor domain-containing protein [Xylaria bambusicola]KAI0521275.1 fungal-specific transcription factor domain-containing protein [Xylaria bambusicola]
MCLRHLTEVEEKLERAKLVIAQLRAQASASLPLPPESTQPIQGFGPELTRPEHFSQSFLPASESDQNHVGSLTRRHSGRSDINRPPAQSWDSYISQVDSPDVRESASSSQDVRDILEASPKDEFEWDEQEAMTSNSASPDVIGNTIEDGNESAITDGMASLAVNERESGYLGVASGAALLRIFATTPRVRLDFTTSRASGQIRERRHSLISQPDTTCLIADAMIDAYFSQYHLSYPIIHEPTFRAQYSEVIPRPHGDCWFILAYMVATIGVWTTATNLENLDIELFAQARALLSFNVLEVGNITLVQALTLISNYEQKRNKPNSGYNYSGLAMRVAMGLGLHKEFQNWNISPLSMEIRRRIWWSLYIFEVGATITFSRPHSWPREGVETSLPLNIDDKSLTALSKVYPKEVDEITPYTALITQAKFHTATTPIYCRVISKPPPSANELLSMESRLIEPWLRSLSQYFSEDTETSQRYRHANLVMKWRLRNFRIIMYRPFVIRKALNARDHRYPESPDDLRAYDICLNQARETITSISTHVAATKCNRLEAWYTLYFLFQAALIPCICLRSDPGSSAADDWKEQIVSACKSIAALASLNSSSARCCQAIAELCGQFVDISHLYRQNTCPSDQSLYDESNQPEPATGQHIMPNSSHPVGESSQGRPDEHLPLFWPGTGSFNTADVFMEDEAWTNLLRSTADEWWPDGS